MENQELKPADLRVDTLGEASIASPLGLSTVFGDNVANYVEDGKTVLLPQDRDEVLALVREGRELPAFQMAGPRQRIFFDPARVKAAIVTCGGLCPGINNVIRMLVMELSYRYGVKSILGIRYGYRGFIPRYGYEPIALTPDFVKDIHEKGGSILCSSRGQQDTQEMLDFLVKRGVSILFAIGGDGTLRGAHTLHEEIRKRGLPISVIGIPRRWTTTSRSSRGPSAWRQRSPWPRSRSAARTPRPSALRTASASSR